MKPGPEAMDPELAALRKINRVLMERVENSVNSTGNNYAIFENNILLQKQVEQRTAELEQRNRQLAELLAEQTRIGEDLQASERRTAMQRSAIAELMVDPDLLKGGENPFLRRIAEVLSETAGVARASLWRLSDDRANLICQTLYDARTRTQTCGEVLETGSYPAYFKAILAGTRICAENAQSDPRTCELADSYLKPLGVVSLLDAGVVVEGRLVGMVCLEHVGPRRKWHPDEESFVAAVAALVAQQLVNTERKRAEASLRAKTEELDRYFTSALDLLCIADTQGHFIRVNKEWERVLGYSVADLEKRTFLEFVHPDDLPATLAAVQHLAGQANILNFTNRYRTKDGSYRYLEWRATPHGNLLYSTARDVTERMNAEEALRQAKEAAEESETRFKALHNASFGGIAIHDQGLILDCNRGLSEMTGFSLDELIGMNGLQLIARQSLDLVKGHIAAQYEKPYEAIGVRKNGEEYPLRLEGRKIPYRGKEVRVVEFRDITEQKQAEAALRASEEKLSAMFASMAEMVVLHEVVLDEAGQPINYRITDCNRAFTEVTGIARETAVGKLATEVFGTPEPPYLQEYCRVGLTGEPLHFETYYAPMDKHFSISVVSPGKNRFATVTSDITDTKKIHHIIAAKNKELEQLVYVASHDLRSPLVNVDGYGRELEYAAGEVILALECEDLAEGQLEAKIRAQLPDITGALRHIRNSTRQMDGLLKGLLKLSRLGRSALDIRPLDMNELLARVASTFQYQIREAGADLRVEDLPPCRGDDVQVVQVFANLVGNALKFRDPARPCVITVGGVVEPGRCVYCVADNGIGIAPEKQEKIFELFHRLDPAKTEGEGLGLTIIRQVLWRLYGEIRVESTPGAGSRFYVSLPKESASQMEKSETVQ